MATAMGSQSDLSRNRGPGEEEVLCAQHVPLPLGCGTSCGSSAGLHCLGHLCPLQAFAGLQRAQPHGLRCLRTPCRAVCHTDGAAPRHHHRAEHCPLPRAAGQDRFLFRLEPRDTHLRPRILSLDTVGLHPHVRLLLRQCPGQGHAYRGAGGPL